jgi:hypothetical protein
MKIWPVISAAFLILTGSGPAGAEDAAVAVVKHYGAAIGGGETIDSLIKMTLRDLKPQSARGIEIYGWHTEVTGAAVCRVSYSYREHGRPMTVLAWVVDMDSGRIRAVNELSRRLMQMAGVL